MSEFTDITDPIVDGVVVENNMIRLLSERDVEREVWIKAATQYMDNQSDINMATIQFHVLMDQIDIAVAGLKEIKRLSLCHDDIRLVACKTLKTLLHSQ